MIAKKFAEIIMNDWLDNYELVVEVDGKQYAARRIETDEVDGKRICILVAEDEMVEGATMNYAGPGNEPARGVFRCSHCGFAVLGFSCDFCPSCGRKIKEWK